MELWQSASFCSPGPFHLIPALLTVLKFTGFLISDFISYFWLWICPSDLMTRFCFSRIILNPCHSSPNIVLHSPSGFIPSQLLWVNTFLAQVLPAWWTLPKTSLPSSSPPLGKKSDIKSLNNLLFEIAKWNMFPTKSIWPKRGKNLSHLTKIVRLFSFWGKGIWVSLLLNKNIF